MTKSRGIKKTKNGEPWQWLTENFMRDTGDCVFFPFAKTSYGYGVLNFNGKLIGAHRLACILANGEPHERKLDAAHSCGMGHLGCVNARHLRWATRSENFSDKSAHGTHNRGERHQNAKLSNARVESILSRLGNESLASLAREFGVSPSLVSMYKSGKRRALQNG